METKAWEVYQFLDKLDIKYQIIEHPPVYTCEELEPYMEGVDGAHCKNLLLRNKKGNRQILVIMEESKQMNIKEFGKQIGISNLSFASKERLLKYLGVTTGAVSIFGLINDVNHEVEVFIDENVMNAGSVNFHPNDNQATVHFSVEDMKKFLDACGNPLKIIKI
ncbi:MAG: prolyl-tRNA synthetase associated domain-containing protein [Eubacterium sp.]